MPTDFDPYHRWLGIPPKEQPANYYRLLGLADFESDPEVIRDAAEQRIAHVRTYQLGPRSALSQQVLNELATAKADLLQPAKKALYDEQLRAALHSPETPSLPARRPAWLLAAVLGGLGLIVGLTVAHFVSRAPTDAARIPENRSATQTTKETAAEPPAPKLLPSPAAPADEKEFYDLPPDWTSVESWLEETKTVPPKAGKKKKKPASRSSSR